MVIRHTANKASVLQNQLLLLLFRSEIGKCVYDDTKDEIKDYNDQDEEEQEIIHNSGDKQRLLKQNVSQSLLVPLIYNTHCTAWRS